MKNEVVHFQLMNGRARAVIVINTGIVIDAVARHALDPIAAIALGRALGCVATLASTLKQGLEYVHLVVDGGGPLGKVVAECNGDGHCRGYTSVKQLQSVITDPKQIPQSVGEAVGSTGKMIVSIGRSSDREPHRTIADMVNGEIATDIAQYLSESDQIPSALAAGVQINTKGKILGAGAALVQQLGGEKLKDDELASLEKRMAGVNISERIASGEGVDEIMNFISDQDPSASMLGRKILEYRCSCTKEKMAFALRSLGKQELESILQDVGKLEVICPYCACSQNFLLSELDV